MSPIERKLSKWFSIGLNLIKADTEHLKLVTKKSAVYLQSPQKDNPNPSLKSGS